MADERRERGPYLSGLARREAILDAAVEVLADFGYHGMSLRDVARKVGISHPGVIYHFPSKEALLMAVIDRYERNAGLFSPEFEQLQGLDRLYYYLGITRRFCENSMIVELECMLAIEASSPLHPAYDHFAQRFRLLQDDMARTCAELQESKIVKDDVDPGHFAITVVSMWYGCQQQWLYDRSVDVERLLRETVSRMIYPEILKEVCKHNYTEVGSAANSIGD